MQIIDFQQEWDQLENGGVPLEPRKYRIPRPPGLLIKPGILCRLIVCKTGCVHCVIPLRIVRTATAKPF